MRALLGKKMLIPVGIVLLAALFLGLNAYRNLKENGVKEVLTAAVIRGPLSFNVLATGVVEPGVKAEIRSKLVGTIDTVLVSEGDTVKAGQRLAAFVQGDLLTQAARAESAVAQARTQERQLKAKAEHWQDQVKSQLAQAESQLAQAVLALEKTRSGSDDQVAAAERDLKNAQLSYEMLKTQLEGSKVTEKDLEAVRKKYQAALAAVRENSRDGMTPLSGYTYHQAQAALLEAEEALRRAEEKYAEQNEDISRKLEQAGLQVAAAADRLASLTTAGGTTRDIATAENQVRAAQAALDLARINAELSRITPEDVAAAEAAVRAAEADYRKAREDLDNSAVTSPIEGTVIAVEAKAGDRVTPGFPLFVIGRTEQVLVKVKVDEVDIGKIALDQPVQISSSAYLGKTFSGTILRIAPRATRDGNINVFEVEVLVENPDGALKPGMSVDATIVADQKKDVLLVPAEAIVERDGNKYAFVDEGGTVRQRRVVTGLSNRTSVEILDGLVEGDRVIAGPADMLKSLKDGDRVKVGGGNR